jgi:hypothetical protein
MSDDEAAGSFKAHTRNIMNAISYHCFLSPTPEYLLIVQRPSQRPTSLQYGKAS